ncbi:MAG TPA: cbb3-type cytochrome oxidase assembly protein CcoS [Candidimonas sp.]|nr:cbb3-type cytochrome oxidase assembly protein CcoS [Candidimonas sp.]
MASSLLLLLPISLAFVIAIGIFFWWAIFSGQFDDSQSAGDSILLDQDTPAENDIDEHKTPSPESTKPG